MEPNQPGSGRAKQTMTLLSIAAGLLCVMMTIALAGQSRQGKAYPLGAPPAVGLEEARASYESDGDPQNLIWILEHLCFQAEVEGKTEAGTEIASYGTKLFELARADKVDLEQVGDEAEMLALIRLLKKYGAQ